jgi:DNA-binding transcriptional MerR regulator
MSELKPGKLYYSIGEVAEHFGVNPSLIRFWEKEFDIIQPKKNAKGNRLFTQQDVSNFRLIHHLVKERGFTLEGARKKLKDNREETINTTEVIDKLNEIKGFLQELQKAL